MLAAHGPYAGVCFRGGGAFRGVLAGGGVLPSWGCASQGGVPLGGCVLPGEVCFPGGVPPLGCVLLGGGVVVFQHALRQNPCEQNDRQV